MVSNCGSFHFDNWNVYMYSYDLTNVTHLISEAGTFQPDLYENLQGSSGGGMSQAQK